MAPLSGPGSCAATHARRTTKPTADKVVKSMRRRAPPNRDRRIIFDGHRYCERRARPSYSKGRRKPETRSALDRDSNATRLHPVKPANRNRGSEPLPASAPLPFLLPDVRLGDRRCQNGPRPTEFCSEHATHRSAYRCWGAFRVFHHREICPNRKATGTLGIYSYAREKVGVVG